MIASQREEIDTIRYIALVIATISSDRLGRYMMTWPCLRSSTDASSSHGVADLDQYVTTGIRSLDDVAAIVGGARHRCHSIYPRTYYMHTISFHLDFGYH